MGLLDNLAESPLFNVGMGLLASSGPSRNPVNPWGGAMQGLLSARQARQERIQMEREAAMQQAAQYKMQQDMERDAALKQWGQQYDAQHPGAAATMFPDLYAKAMATAEEEKAKRVTAEMSTAGALGLQGVDPNLPVTVKRAANGDVVDYSIGSAALTQPSGPSDVQEYEYAKRQGYGGTYEQWVLSKGAASAAKIDMGGNDRVSVQDAATLRYTKDGSPVNPGELWEDVRKKGVRVATRADVKVEEMRAKQDAAQSESAIPLADYSAAAEAWRAEPNSPEAFARVQQERRRLGQMLAQARNPGRAPTDADVSQAMDSIPSPMSLLSGAAAVTGGDPFHAQLEIVGKELGVGPAGGKSPAPGKPKGGIFEKYPFLKDAP